MIWLVALATLASQAPLDTSKPIRKPSWWIPGEGSGWIDVAPREGNHLLIRVTIDGEPAWAMVDTGFESVTLSKRFADAHHLGLTPIPGTAPASFGGTTRFYYVAGVSMTIGGVHTEAPSVSQAVDLGGLSNLDVPLDAVIGLDMMRIAGLEVDEDHHRLRFVMGGRFNLPPHGALRLGPEDTRLVTDVAIGGTPATVMIDTGSDAGLTIAPTLAARAGVHAVTDGMAAGAGGDFVSGIGAVPSVAIGGRQAANVPAEISDQVMPVTHGRIDAMVGMGLLHRYNFVLDLAQHALWLGERSEPVPPDPVSTSGIQGDAASGRGAIVHVMKHSPAEAAGLKAGDMVCAVNGKAPWPHWGRATPGTRYTVRLCNGRSVDLVTRAFY